MSKDSTVNHIDDLPIDREVDRWIHENVRGYAYGMDRLLMDKLASLGKQTKFVQAGVLRRAVREKEERDGKSE